MNVYEQLGVEPIINLSGAVTRLGGAPMSNEVLAAFAEAAAFSVPLEKLQAAASKKIAAMTNAEAGIVTAGCAAALTLGAAAILARYDLGRMERLPDCEDIPNEFVIARDQRNGYDHAVRATGAKLVEVGMHEVVAGAGVRRAEAWEYAAAIGPRTAGVLYVMSDHAQPALAQVVAVAQKAGLPVLVDAAGALPPRTRLQDFLEQGADLVAFSGGKAICGPQSTGILCGRRDLVASALLQMLDMDDHLELWEPDEDIFAEVQLPGLPRHGIGRALKVSKEEIVALLTALERFASGEGANDEITRQLACLTKLQKSLEGLPVIGKVVESPHVDGTPILFVEMDRRRTLISALEACRRLRKGRPPIYCGHGRLSEGMLVIHPMHLQESQIAIIVEQLRCVLA